MTFTQVCVGMVICLGLLFITGLFGKLISWTTDDESMWFFISWFFSTIGFAVCLTIVLYIKGGLS
jgi:predicted permease